MNQTHKSGYKRKSLRVNWTDTWFQRVSVLFSISSFHNCRTKHYHRRYARVCSSSMNNHTALVSFPLGNNPFILILI